MTIQCGVTWDTLTELGIVHCEREQGHGGEHRCSPDGQQSISWGGLGPKIVEACAAMMALTDAQLHEAIEQLENYRPGSKARLREWLSPAPQWPDWLPQELYLTTHEGRSSVYLAESADGAINQADHYRALRAHIYRVTAIEVEEMAIQRQIVRQGLVPKGTEVTS